MTKLIFLLASSFFISLSAAHYFNERPETYLILNMANDHELPRNFRTTLNPLPEDSSVNDFGLAELNVSGSGQFSVNSLSTLIENIPHHNIVIVDLREEPHAMMNDMAITWYSSRNWTNIGLTRHEINLDTQERIERLYKHPPKYIYKSKAAEQLIPVVFESARTEEDAVQELGLPYHRIMARDHTRPPDTAVDDFVSFVKNMDADTWLHFHCSAGRGRTTTFMVLYDIIRNGRDVSLEDISKRQELIGGRSVLESDDTGWKKEHADLRKEFVEEFYQYCQEHPQLDISWTEWSKKQEL